MSTLTERAGVWHGMSKHSALSTSQFVSLVERNNAIEAQGYSVEQSHNVAVLVRRLICTKCQWCHKERTGCEETEL